MIYRPTIQAVKRCDCTAQEPIGAGAAFLIAIPTSRPPAYTSGISRNIQLTSSRPWAIIPPSSSDGACMSVPSSIISILLLTADTDVHLQFKATFTDAVVTIAPDAGSLPNTLPTRPFDIVVLESRSEQEPASQNLSAQIDLSHALVITGSRSVLRRAPAMIQMLTQQREQAPKSNGHDLSLEDFLDQKMGDFVKGMHNGAAKNLHPMLISAVERPLISSALRETQGNQIQAAELLGLNRNTLRKKITDLHIPLKRGRAKTARTL
ncbi:MAG: hypothetical protein IT389_07705 [Nitrospira sp.]|nr:hypothetical protein [Nitrospira sp.]